MDRLNKEEQLAILISITSCIHNFRFTPNMTHNLHSDLCPRHQKSIEFCKHQLNPNNSINTPGETLNRSSWTTLSAICFCRPVSLRYNYRNLNVIWFSMHVSAGGTTQEQIMSNSTDIKMLLNLLHSRYLLFHVTLWPIAITQSINQSINQYSKSTKLVFPSRFISRKKSLPP